VKGLEFLIDMAIEMKKLEFLNTKAIGSRYNFKLA